VYAHALPVFIYFPQSCLPSHLPLGPSLLSGFTAVVSRPPPVASFSLCDLRPFVIKRTYSSPRLLPFSLLQICRLLRHSLRPSLGPKADTVADSSHRTKHLHRSLRLLGKGPIRHGSARGQAKQDESPGRHSCQRFWHAFWHLDASQRSSRNTESGFTSSCIHGISRICGARATPVSKFEAGQGGKRSPFQKRKNEAAPARSRSRRRTRPTCRGSAGT
jgi:hypothetical protein